jgi:hypothetical protein
MESHQAEYIALMAAVQEASLATTKYQQMLITTNSHALPYTQNITQFFKLALEHALERHSM